MENPRDGGAWWAAVYGVTQSRTRLKRLSSSSSSNPRRHLSRSKPCTKGSQVPVCLMCCVLRHFSRVLLFVTLWTLAHQGPLSMGFSRQEYWSGLACPPSGHLPNPGIKPSSHVSCSARWSFTNSNTWEGCHTHVFIIDLFVTRHLGYFYNKWLLWIKKYWLYKCRYLLQITDFSQDIPGGHRNSRLRICLERKRTRVQSFVKAGHTLAFASAAAAAAKSLQSCPTLCGDPIDGSPTGSSIPGILQARTLEWVAISFSNAWKWKVKVKLLSRVRFCATPRTAAYQAPQSMGFSRQEYWSGVPLPSPCFCFWSLRYTSLRNSMGT